ncbi:unnamed protein product, partial [Choristocarpus tenellus]
PFPVRQTRRRRLSLAEVKCYRDIALISGHTGSGLARAKHAFSDAPVGAARLADIMRQVDLGSAGSLGRQEFLLALERARVPLDADAKHRLYQALDSAGTGRGCDIEMFTQLVNYWGR